MFDFLSTVHSIVALSPEGGGEGGGGLLSLIVPFALIFGIMYFLVIRPQAKKQKEQEKFLSSLKTGDKVVTSGGIMGRVTGVADNMVTVEISDRVRVKVLRSMIASKADTALAAESGEKKDDKKKEEGETSDDSKSEDGSKASKKKKSKK